MTRFYTLNKVMVLFCCHCIDNVHAGLVHGKDIRGGEDSNVGGYHRGGGRAFAVAGDGHVAHYVHVGDVLSKKVYGGLGALCHTLHELFLSNIPLVGLAGSGMDPGFAHTAIGTSYADILVGAAESALGVALEVGEGYH